MQAWGVTKSNTENALRGSPVSCMQIPGRKQERIRGIRSGKKGMDHRS